jgi:hypothetical protein
MATIYSDRCPKCNATIRVYLRPDALRVGPEVYVCSCGETYRSGYVEWAPLTSREKFEYFVSEGAIGILVMLPLLGGVAKKMAQMTRPGEDDFQWQGFYWGLGIAAIALACLWCGKTINVRRSIQRVQPR